jgi:YihY family inner membrane protein
VRLREMPAVRFVLAVQRRFGEDEAGFLAASLTYYSFLSLFPLLLLAASVLGFLLAGDPMAQREWAGRLSRSVPGLEGVLGENIQALVDARAATGLLGVAGLLWSGIGASEAATYALGRIARVQARSSLLRQKARSLATTLGIGALGLLGLGVVAAVASVDVGGVGGVALKLLGPLVGVVLDFGLFLLAFRFLTPGRGRPFGRLWRGALSGALAWTALKLVGTWYVARVVADSSAVYGTLGGAVGALLLLSLAARIFLYGAEINAVAG